VGGTPKPAPATQTNSCQKHFLQDHLWQIHCSPCGALAGAPLGGGSTPGCVALRASSPGVIFVWRFAPLWRFAPGKPLEEALARLE